MCRNTHNIIMFHVKQLKGCDYMSFVSEFIDVIRKHCVKQNHCTDCIFYSDKFGCCSFDGQPIFWDIDKILSAYYKLLKGGKPNEIN